MIEASLSGIITIPLEQSTISAILQLPSNINIKFEESKSVFEEVQFLGIGLGAFLGGSGGLVLFIDWFKRNLKERNIMSLRKKFPRSLLNKDFEIVSSRSNFGWWFIIDNRNNTRHWITSLETLTELGYSTNDGKTISNRKFNSYTEGKEIKIDRN